MFGESPPCGRPFSHTVKRDGTEKQSSSNLISAISQPGGLRPLLPPGVGGAKRRMRVQARTIADTRTEPSPPTPLPAGEGLLPLRYSANQLPKSAKRGPDVLEKNKDLQFCFLRGVAMMRGPSATTRRQARPAAQASTGERRRCLCEFGAGLRLPGCAEESFALQLRVWSGRPQGGLPQRRRRSV